MKSNLHSPQTGLIRLPQTPKLFVTLQKIQNHNAYIALIRRILFFFFLGGRVF